MLELTQTLLLGADQFPAPLASLLATGNLRVHLCHELVAVLSLAAQQAPIEQVRAFPIAGNRRMHLAHVDARAVFSSSFFQGQLLFLRQAFPDLVGRDGFVLAPRPVDDDGLRKIPLPEQDQRGSFAFPTAMRRSIGLGCSAERTPACVLWGFFFRLCSPHPAPSFWFCPNPQRPCLTPKKPRLSARPLRHGGLQRVQWCHVDMPVTPFWYRHGIPCGCQVSLQELGLNGLFSLSLCLVWRCATRVRRMASQFPCRVPSSVSITSVFPCLAPPYPAVAL